MKRNFDKIDTQEDLAIKLRRAEAVLHQGNYLFIISHGEQTEREVRFYSYTATPESFRFVKEIVDSLEEYSRCGYDPEEPRILFDIFTYLCGNWKAARPPCALPCGLWLTPRESFGKWEALGDDGFFLATGSWSHIVHTAFYDEIPDGDDEERSVSKGDWDNQEQFEQYEEFLRKERENKKQKRTDENH